MRQHFPLAPVIALGLCLAFAHPASATSVTFGIGADDYGTLTIDGTLVASFNNNGPAGGANGTFNMTPGVWYSISIDYQNRYGTDGLSLSWNQSGPAPASLGYGSSANTLAPNLVPLASLRTIGPTGGYVSGLTGNYYYPNGTYAETVIGEGPIDAINNIYNNAVSTNNWAGFTYDQQFEERLTGQIELAPAATPLPAALPLFATGLGGLGLLGWRRKRKAAALAATASLS